MFGMTFPFCRLKFARWSRLAKRTSAGGQARRNRDGAKGSDSRRREAEDYRSEARICRRIPGWREPMQRSGLVPAWPAGRGPGRLHGQYRRKGAKRRRRTSHACSGTRKARKVCSKPPQPLDTETGMFGGKQHRNGDVSVIGWPRAWRRHDESPNGGILANPPFQQVEFGSGGDPVSAYSVEKLVRWSPRFACPKSRPLRSI